MSQVIRDVILRLRLEQTKSKLEAPNAADIEKSWKAGYRAAKEVEQAAKDATKATKEYDRVNKEAGDSAQRSHRDTERVVTDSGYRMGVSFREGGEGALRMARGIAFLSASGGDSLQALVRHVAVAQGAFDIFAGGFKMVTNLSRAFGGPAALAVTAVTSAITLGVLAWQRWKHAAEEAAKAAKEKLKQAEIQANATANAVVQGRDRLARDQEAAGLSRTGAIVTPEQRRAAEAELSRQRSEQLFVQGQMFERAERQVRQGQRRGDTPIPEDASTFDVLALGGMKDADRTRIAGLARQRQELLAKELAHQEKLAAERFAAGSATLDTARGVLGQGTAFGAGIGGAGGLALGIGAAGVTSNINQELLASANAAKEYLQQLSAGMEAVATLARRLDNQIRNMEQGQSQ